MADFVLEMNNITKEYGNNTVLKDVTLSIRPGEIHALLGENGAGKSTLMNILFGMPVIHSTGGFKGQILIDGKETKIISPMDAMKKGIGMVHQEFMLIPGFSITENIKLNRELSKRWFGSSVFGKEMEMLDGQSMSSDARKALNSVGMSIDESAMVGSLPIGHMQFVEIAREIDKKDIKLLVFDEPTAVLTESEALQLISVMKDIAARGIAIIFITHRLDEVMNAADRITILRDGRLVKTLNKEETGLSELAALMIGRGNDGSIGALEPREHGDRIAMRIRDLWVDMPGESVKGVDLDIYEGEIIGVAGLAGQGKIGLPNGVMGLYPATGSVCFRDKQLPLNNPAAALSYGIAKVSEDRRNVGLLLDQSIEDNIVFSAMQVKGKFLTKGIRLKKKGEIRSHAEKMIRALDIRCTSATQATGTLSGGNQQKVCVARALTLGPTFLFVSEPTRGIDIGAKQLVLETLTRLNREEGLTIVVVSSELQELRNICDRIAIISEGKISAILKPTDSDVDFGLAMSGMKVNGGEAV